MTNSNRKNRIIGKNPAIPVRKNKKIKLLGDEQIVINQEVVKNPWILNLWKTTNKFPSI